MREQQKYIVCCHTSVQTGWITMKKLLATVLVLSIVVGLIGCSAASAPTVQPAPTEQTSKGLIADAEIHVYEIGL